MKCISVKLYTATGFCGPVLALLEPSLVPSFIKPKAAFVHLHPSDFTILYNLQVLHTDLFNTLCIAISKWT